MQFDAIFFDIGNTLYFYDYEFLCELLSERFGIAVGGAELAEAHRKAQLSVISQGLEGLAHDEIWDRTYGRWFELVGVEGRLQGKIIDSIRRHPFKHMFWTRMDEGTKEMLDWFRERGMRLGVISNAEGQIKRLLDHTGLDSRFEVVIDSSEVGVAKPDTEIFRIALEGLGVLPERSIYVGDLIEIDVAGARGAGLTPILVDRDGRNSDADCITVARAVDLPNLSIFSGV